MYIVQIERRSTVVFSISDMGLTPELSSSYGFDFHTDFFDFQTKVIAEALCSGIEATLSVWETADSQMKLVSISWKFTFKDLFYEIADSHMKLVSVSWKFTWGFFY